MLEKPRGSYSRKRTLTVTPPSSPFEAVLEVLPVPRSFGGEEQKGAAAGAAADFEVLEKLRRLAFAKDVDEPKQLELWKGEVVAAGA